MPSLYSIRTSMTLCKDVERVVAGFRKELTKVVRSSDEQSGLNNSATLLYSEYVWFEPLSGDNNILIFFTVCLIAYQ